MLDYFSKLILIFFALRLLLLQLGYYHNDVDLIFLTMGLNIVFKPLLEKIKIFQ